MSIQQLLNDNVDKIISYYNSGIGMPNIGKKIGCSPANLFHWFKKRNIPIRSFKKTFGTIENYKEDIIKLHSEGLSAYAISKKLVVSKKTVLRWFKKLNLSTSEKSTKREDQLINHIQEIIELYESGINTLQISKKFNCGQSSIWRLLRANNIKTRSNTIYNVNHSFFDKIDTEQKAYILGFWYADGNNSKTGRAIKLQITDLEILKEIKKVVEYTGPLYIKKKKVKQKHKTMYTLFISSVKLSQDLTNVGCMAKKSLIIKFPTCKMVPEHLISHFVRGYFDGDGSISFSGKYKAWKIQIVGTKHMLEGIKNSNDFLGFFNQRYPEFHKDNWNLTIYRVSEVKRFMDYIYQDATIFLKRKHDRFIQFIIDKQKFLEAHTKPILI